MKLRFKRYFSHHRATLNNYAAHIYSLTEYTANILKAYVQDENNNFKSSSTFSNCIRSVPIEDDEIMVSLDVTSL